LKYSIVSTATTDTLHIVSDAKADCVA